MLQTLLKTIFPFCFSTASRASGQYSHVPWGEAWYLVQWCNSITSSLDDVSLGHNVLVKCLNRNTWLKGHFDTWNKLEKSFSFFLKSMENIWVVELDCVLLSLCLLLNTSNPYYTFSKSCLFPPFSSKKQHNNQYCLIQKCVRLAWKMIILICNWFKWCKNISRFQNSDFVVKSYCGRMRQFQLMRLLANLPLPHLIHYPSPTQFS